MNDELQDEELYTYTLTDDEGNEYEFELLGTAEIDGKTYYALVPTGDNGGEEYAILRAEEDEEGVNLVTIDDDDEWEKVADFFDDQLFNDVDYDA